MKFQLLDTEKFKKVIPYPPRNYWDFPVVCMTFCESLSYSRPVWFHDCLFRDVFYGLPAPKVNAFGLGIIKPGAGN